MKSNSIKIQFFKIIVWACALANAGCTQNLEQKLPTYGRQNVNQKEINGNTVIDTVYHKIPEFRFLNQDSSFISQDFFDHKIYIANFFFTSCPSICPVMQRNLLIAYEKYKDDKRVAFLSHSIDYRNDHPGRLKEYAKRLGVDNDQWQFVTGKKNEVFNISKEYLVFTEEDENAPGGYDHQGLLILIDQERRIRGVYDGTVDEQVQKLLSDIKILLKEYNKEVNLSTVSG